MSRVTAHEAKSNVLMRFPCKACGRLQDPEGLVCSECATKAARQIDILKSHVTDLTAQLTAAAVSGREEKDSLQKQLRFLRTWDEDMLNPPHTDVRLRGADGSAPVDAHRSVLASRSPVWKAMFSSSMREQSTGVVEIEDIPDEVLAAFVSFMYTSEVSEDSMKKLAEPLLESAVKYDVQYLEEVCEHYLVENRVPNSHQYASDNSLESACDTAVSLFQLAYRHDLQALKDAVVDRMVGNKTAGHHKKFLSSGSFVKLKKEEPTVALQICEAIALRFP